MTQEQKNAMFAAMIRKHMETGKDLPEAFDAVFGPGAYRKLAGEVYNALRSK